MLKDIKFRNYSLIVLFIFLLVIEISAYKYHGVAENIAALLWFASGGLTYVYILYLFMERLIKDIKSREPSQILSCGLIFLLLIALILVYGKKQFGDINPDATQQLSAGLKAWKQRGFNYTGHAFLGYPARQYILVSVPSLIFGRNIFSLQAGFGLPVVAGMASFYLGLREVLSHKKTNIFWSFIACVGIVSNPYFVEYYLNFEQAILPLAFTMQAMGFFLILVYGKKKENKSNFLVSIALFWTGCMLGTSYTPSLSGLGLLIFFIIFLIINKV